MFNFDLKFRKTNKKLLISFSNEYLENKILIFMYIFIYKCFKLTVRY